MLRWGTRAGVVAALNLGAVGWWTSADSKRRPSQTPDEAPAVNHFPPSITPEKTLSSQLLVSVGLGLGIVVSLGLAFASTRFKRCPSNEILVIFGRTRSGKAKTVHGGGAYVWPIFQDYGFLNLSPLQIEVPLRSALSQENIRINVPSVFTVGIGTDEDTMQTAAIRLLDMDRDAIAHQARDIIFGQMRLVIASMNIQDITRDRDKFQDVVKENVVRELRNVGLVLLNVNITDITDESEFLEALGRKASAEAVQKARVDVANAKMLGAVGEAVEKKSESIGVAQNKREQEVGLAFHNKQQVIKVAEMQKREKVQRNAAELKQKAAISEQEKLRRVKVAEEEALAIRGENLAAAAVAASNAELAIKQAEAYRESEAKKRAAHAAVLEAESLAEAKASEAKGAFLEAKLRAELEAVARAYKAQVIVDAEAEAVQIRLAAEAQARRQFLELEAQAKGNFALLQRKAQGLEELVRASGGAQNAFQLQMLDHLETLADTSTRAIQKLNIQVDVWDGKADADGSTATSKFIRGLTKSLPSPFEMIKDVSGLSMPAGSVGSVHSFSESTAPSSSCPSQ